MRQILVECHSLHNITDWFSTIADRQQSETACLSACHKGTELARSRGQIWIRHSWKLLAKPIVWIDLFSFKVVIFSCLSLFFVEATPTVPTSAIFRGSISPACQIHVPTHIIEISHAVHQYLVSCVWFLFGRQNYDALQTEVGRNSEYNTHLWL